VQILKERLSINVSVLLSFLVLTFSINGTARTTDRGVETLRVGVLFKDGVKNSAIALEMQGASVDSEGSCPLA
jgi:hypothetical protein